MPYIKQTWRKSMDGFLKAFESYLELRDFTGRLNYFLFKLAKHNIHCYSDAQKFIGELECTKQEIYRRIIAPYEDKKIKENGDVK